MTINFSIYESDYCSEVVEMNAAYFARNSSVLTVEARASLQENLQILSDCPNTNVRVEGFAAPGERNAQSLSEDRARAVEQFYSDNAVAVSRIMAVGQGRVQGQTSKKEGIEQFRRADTIPLR
jgi:outer membrane protein OmpA-like peptidoglycan-associated protein